MSRFRAVATLARTARRCSGLVCLAKGSCFAGCLLATLLADVSVTHAETIEIFPPGPASGCDEEFERVANALQPGDELVLHDGEYRQSCRRAITVRGTADKPVVIRAAAGAAPLLTRPVGDIDDNNIEITGEHVTLRGLRFRGGSIGVRFFAGHHVTFEDNEVFDTATTAVTLNSGDTDAFTIRGNHIHHSGLVGDDTEGEGLYVGCHDGSCVASNHLIEDNRIHHLRGTSSGGNDGIELKFRSHGIVVRGNEIHDTNIGRAFPCIFSYGGGDGAPNVIENNLVYRCGEAILVTADTIVRNNVVLDSSSHGIHARAQRPSFDVRNVTIVNNTVAGSHPVCAQLRWRGGANLAFANNALLCPDAVALRASGLGDTLVRRNAVVGTVSGARVDGTALFRPDATDDLFVAPAQRDFRLRAGAALVDAGSDSVPGLAQRDFAGVPRVAGTAVDVGAHEFVPPNGGPPRRGTSSGDSPAAQRQAAAGESGAGRTGGPGATGWPGLTALLLALHGRRGGRGRECVDP